MVWSSATVTGVVVSVIATMALGMLWYSPLFFGNLFMRLQGISPKQIAKAKEKGMAGTWLMAWVIQIVQTLVFAHLALNLKVVSLATFVSYAIALWLGFVTTTQYNGVLWGCVKKRLYLINTGYSIASLVLTAVIFYFLH